MNQTALLVIDLQRGAFDGARIAPIAHADTLIGHAATLVAAARGAGVPVVFIQHGEDEGPFETRTPHWELHEALAPQPGEGRVHKRQSSAFDGTGLAGQLQALGARDLILCGLQSEFCVSNTARSALAQGFAVTVVQDAHGTWPEGGETAEAISARVNAQLQAAGARLATTQDLARSLANG
ncbi:MAG TPA: cysteine hydrolase family protein [Burkholderiaceae bacterium]|nr:cysteine hydrolase family protein [Burkholderiaceae bacterium]